MNVTSACWVSLVLTSLSVLILLGSFVLGWKWKCSCLPGCALFNFFNVFFRVSVFLLYFHMLFKQTHTRMFLWGRNGLEACIYTVLVLTLLKAFLGNMLKFTTTPSHHSFQKICWAKKSEKKMKKFVGLPHSLALELLLLTCLGLNLKLYIYETLPL